MANKLGYGDRSFEGTRTKAAPLDEHLHLMIRTERKCRRDQGAAPLMTGGKKTRMRTAAGPQDIGVENAGETEHDLGAVATGERGSTMGKDEQPQAAAGSGNSDPADIEVVNRAACVERIDGKLMPGAGKTVRGYDQVAFGAAAVGVESTRYKSNPAH